ncbi:MAG: PRC-barrel domain-containing protein [Desulfobacterales bacterium]|jgi:sporulation protein YlmC with PRC-barrel domain
MESTERVSDMRGILVVAYEEGLQLGKVSNIHFEKQSNKIMGISFKSGLLSIEKESFVSFENIQKLGKDVVIISEKAAATQLPAEFAEHSLKALKGFRVITQDGTYIGELSDFHVSLESGTISEIILADDKKLAITPEDVTIGTDVMLVPTGYTARLQENKGEKEGIFARMFDAAWGEPVKRKVRGTVEKVGETLFDTAKVRDTVKDTVEKVGDTVGRVLKKSELKKEKTSEQTEQKGSEQQTVEAQPKTSGQEGEGA